MSGTNKEENKMSFDRAVILIVAGLIAAAMWANWPDSKASVEIKPAQAEGEIYKRPVREGNCWRQFYGKDSKDSVLVCG